MTEILLYIFGAAIMLIGLAASIALHEIGHLLPAKLFGVKVTQYMVGFGKTLWSRRKGETEYGVKAIPLGGYVAMIGMYPPKKPGETPRASSTGFLNTVVEEGATAAKKPASSIAAELERIGDVDAATNTDAGDQAPHRGGISAIVDDARLASAETIAENEDHRTFYRLAMWKKITVMLGGPLMNLVLAFVFFGIVLVGFGTPQYTTTLAQVNQCLVAATQSTSACTPDAQSAPAAAAGLLPGDHLESVNGTAIENWDAFRALVAASPGVALDVSYTRDGVTHTTVVTPEPNQRAVVDANGNALTHSDGSVRYETVGMIGASPSTENVRQPITAVPGFVGDTVGRTAGIIVQLPDRMVATWNAAFGSEKRDPNGPMSVVGVGRLAGEIVSTDAAPVSARAASVLGLLGSLNIALFVFNLVPLMPLDGGHIAGALYEGAKRRIAKWRGKPDPGPIDTAKMVPVTFVVVVLLGAMSLLLMYADIVKPVTLG